MTNEDLTKSNIQVTEVEGIWARRRNRMQQRRAYFEPLWRAGISRFFEGIISQANNGSRPLYNSLYEQYDISMFSRDGLRFNQLRYPFVHALTMRGLAAELPNKPKVNFVAVGSNDPTKATAFRHLFNQVLYEMDADEEDFEVFLDKRIFGSAICLVTTEQYDLTVQDPEYVPSTGSYKYVKKTKKVRQCLYKKLDLRHVLLDEHCVKSSLKDCRYAEITEYFSPGEAEIRFAGKEYDQNQVKKALACPVQKDEAMIYEQLYDTKDIDFIRVSHCMDVDADRYHVLLNGNLVNGAGTPLPRIAGRRGKELPLALAVQYKMPGAPYGYADAHITTSFNHIKNLVRLMVLEITQKSAKPLMAIDPMSAFDEQGFEWGQDFIRVSPNELKEVKMTPDLGMLYKLDETTDNDVIRASGLNINDTTNQDASETARKTIIRRESQNALIEMGMNYMASSFFSRLYRLLKDDVKLHYGAMLKAGMPIQVKTEGEYLRRKNGGFDTETVDGFRYFDLQPEDIDFDLELDLELGNLASSRELDKAIQKEGIEAMLQVPPDGFSPEGLARWIAEINAMPDYVLAKAEQSMQGTPEEIARGAISDPGLLPESMQPQNLQPKPEQQIAQAQNVQENETGIPPAANPGASILSKVPLNPAGKGAASPPSSPARI
jgi:hypothetical protein